MSGLTYRRGDVVLVRVDFTDRLGSKVRPAVVVSSDGYNRTSPDVLIASITSNLNAVSHAGDRPILQWKSAGLLKPSLAQAKLATVEVRTIVRVLGKLDPVDMKEVDEGLRVALGL